MIEDLLAELLVSADVRSARRRAKQIYTVLEGAVALMLVHGHRSHASTATEVGKLILLNFAPARTQRSGNGRGG